MKTYRGDRIGGCVVTVDGRPLPPRLDLRNHSPTGFEWGYGGSGPAQLALAILCDHLGDDDLAEGLYHAFKRHVVAGLPQGPWTLTTEDIDRSLAEIELEWHAPVRSPQAEDPPAQRWVTFITEYQAQPGRRMRWNEHASHVWTVKERVICRGRQHIVFAEGGTVPVQEARRKRWQVEV